MIDSTGASGPSSSAFSRELEWLYGTQLIGIKLGLETMRRLIELIGLPGKAQIILHVAGTNGKGSTCAMIDAISRAGHHSTGLFTSPHLVRFTERIRVDGQPIPEAEAARRLQVLREKVSGWSPHPTFFELTTALGMWWFRDAGAQVIVLETGMGGRLDATNAFAPRACAITPIGLDHRQWLGDTIEQIAVEKAGIIKPGVPVVSAPQEPDALRVIERVARENGAPLSVVDFPWTGPVSLAGTHQRWNASLALATMGVAGLAAPAEALAMVEWPGRFQRLGWDGRIVLDGAHNAHGARALAATWREVFGQETATVIFGAVATKDHAEMIAALQPIASRFVLTTVDSPRAVPAATLAAHAPPGSPVTDSLAAALAAVPRSPGHPPVLICGSLYLVGQALAELGGYQDSFEHSAQ
ncbi:MAG: bifunctional folylpolyglutamate synthase/dihydrofolate synthase [Verrucomicrobiales bacterium]